MQTSEGKAGGPRGRAQQKESPEGRKGQVWSRGPRRRGAPGSRAPSGKTPQARERGAAQA